MGLVNCCRVQLHDAISHEWVTLVLKVPFTLEFIGTVGSNKIFNVQHKKRYVAYDGGKIRNRAKQMQAIVAFAYASDP